MQNDPMKKFGIHTALPYSPLSHTAWYVTLMLTAGLLFAACAWQMRAKPVLLIVSSGDTPLVPYTISYKPASKATSSRVIPLLLSQKDIEIYKTVFAAQKKADWKAADAAIATLDNTILLGHVLAERYTSRRFKATPENLSEWLIKYNDHPKAAAIYSLAMAKAPSLRNQVPEVRKQRMLNGYGDDIGLAARGDAAAAHMPTWQAGLRAWKAGKKATAARLFSSVAQRKDISPWTASGAAYWSWRAYKDTGNQKEAQKYLRMAAAEPRSFYGILARRQLHADLELDTKPIQLTEGDVLEMISSDPAIRRTIALTQAGHPELADKELRMAFPQADERYKVRLLALAQALDLASVQISMAKQLGYNDRGFDSARYPIPMWQPEGGFTIDPALMFALMRQESGFRASAVSHAGAMGLMQLMPQTASFIRKKAGVEIEEGSAAEPVINVTLGQNYVQHLLDNKLVEGNLFYLLTAYNAGAGRLQDWKKSLGHKDDPLLFVESIPYPETRYYVMQVMANYWIYSELIGSSNSSLYALLHNQWPSYNDGTPLAARSAAADRNG